MKHLLSTLAVALVAVVMWSCSGDSGPVALTVTSSSLQFSANGGTQSVTVTSEPDLVATPSQSWCTTKVDVEKQILSVSAKKNYAAVARNAEILLTSGAQSQVITVNQKAGTGKILGFKEISNVAYPELSPTGGDDVEVSSVANKYKFSVILEEPKYSWRVESISEDFVTTSMTEPQKGSGYLQIEVAANPTVEARESVVLLVCEYEGAKDTYELTVVQSPTHNNEDPIINNEIDW